MTTISTLNKCSFRLQFSYFLKVFAFQGSEKVLFDNYKVQVQLYINTTDINMAPIILCITPV
jgi:hypothetical protein